MRPPLRPVLATALRCRCPNCRQGRVFRGWPNRVLEECPHCRLRFFREPGYFMGGMILTYIFVAFVLLAAYLLTLLSPAITALPSNTKMVAGMVVAVVLTVLFVRFGYSLWLSVDFWIAPWEPPAPGDLNSRPRARNREVPG